MWVSVASQKEKVPLSASEQVHRTVRMSGEGRGKGGGGGRGGQRERGAFAQRSLIKK